MAAADEVAPPFTRLWLPAGVHPRSAPSEVRAASPAAQVNISSPSVADVPLRVASFNLLADMFAQGVPEGEPRLPAPAVELRTIGAKCEADLAAEESRSINGEGADRSASVRPVVPEFYACVPGFEDAPSTGNHFRCPASCLAWNLRYPSLLDLISEHAADIVGLQEVDMSKGCSHSEELHRDLGKRGYRGVVKKKLGRAGDGVGVFWRTDKFKSVGTSEVWRLGEGVHIAVAQRLRIRGRRPTQDILAISVHLKAGLTEAAESARVLQLDALGQRLKASSLPGVVLADLNAHCRPARGRSGEHLEPEVYGSLLRYGLRSAYREASGCEPKFTCWGGWRGYDVAGVFDYILSFGDQMSARRVLGMPPTEEVLRHGDRLPNAVFPSDHFPLVADLVLTSNSKDEETLSSEEEAVGKLPVAYAAKKHNVDSVLTPAQAEDDVSDDRRARPLLP